jgi:hypothetical protein
LYQFISLTTRQQQKSYYHSISEAKQAIVKALFLTSIVGLIVSLMGIFSGTFNAFGWSAVVIFVFLTAGYFYFWFIKPETA